MAELDCLEDPLDGTHLRLVVVSRIGVWPIVVRCIDCAARVEVFDG